MSTSLVHLDPKQRTAGDGTKVEAARQGVRKSRSCNGIKSQDFDQRSINKENSTRSQVLREAVLVPNDGWIRDARNQRENETGWRLRMPLFWTARKALSFLVRVS